MRVEEDAKIVEDRSVASRNFSEPQFSSLCNGDLPSSQRCYGDQERKLMTLGLSWLLGILLTPLTIENENPDLDSPFCPSHLRQGKPSPHGDPSISAEDGRHSS